MSNLESEYHMQQNYWWKLKKGRGIRVKIIDDIDKETGKQKYRPAIVIKSYPSHVKVQLMTTESSNHDYFKIKIDNQIQYIRPIYYRTIKFNEIADIWKDKCNKPIQLDKNSTLFTKIQEMEIKENLGYEINLNKTQSLEKENQQLKKQICVQSLKLKN
ncbi:hypothetical protein [Spiroplasma ixodetis]|uniref:hypothetical protein n=1 Tax=Spiroplasma ixodetis TaxID=2141 RepID=UPI002574F6D0|nr:hypothetical protein [Spiroplasma ixodetis]WJG71299.1 hypothetical protein SIXOD_v1c26950 [Spiroplasma ixodetis Y32]